MYLALYRKYRPQTFDDVISQEHITTTLKNQLKSGQTAHAYLFTGSRGTGKTTCAKILAKAINCLNPVDGNPCLECECCKAIDEDASDVTEIDAASNNGVDNVRDLKDEAMYAPIVCKKRVYIIDEVHMLSTSAFNALLKLIEEPPPHVVFIFATTEIHKVPATILSRCQRFEFRRIDINDSKKRLLEIAEKEGMQLDENAAYLISRISDGGMRDALSLLDQCFSTDSHVTEETVRNCAGISGTQHLFDIAAAVLKNDSAATLEILDGLVQRSKSPTRLIEELISHYRTLMLLKAGADRNVLRMTDDEERQYRQQSDEYTLEMILRALSLLNETFAGMSRSRNETLSCEMCLIKLCTPKLDTDEKALSGRIDALERLVNNALKNPSGIQAVPVRETAPQKSAPADRPAAVPADKPAETYADKPEPINIPTAPAPQPVQAEAPREKENIPAETAPQAEPKKEQPAMPIDLPFDLDEPPAPPEPEQPAAVFDEPLPPEPPTDAFPPEPVSLSEALGIAPEPLPEQHAAPPQKAPQAEPKKAPQTHSQDGFEPFAEWQDIINTLPFSSRILISDTTALINGNTVIVCGSELQKSYAIGEFAAEVREAVSKAIGRRVTLTAQEEAVQKDDSEEKLTDFLDFAKSQGVSIKEQ